jgi:competence protein ComEC
MSDRAWVATAVASVVAALAATSGAVDAGLSVPAWAPLAAAGAGVVVLGVVRRPAVLLVVAVTVVGLRAAVELSRLESPVPHRVAGEASLVSDPEPGPYGTSVVVRLDGRRFRAAVPRELEGILVGMLAGDRVVLAGRTSAFRSAPEAWRRSRHLAAELRVDRLERGPPAPVWAAAANTVRRSLERGAAGFDDQTRALYLGLVVGDDRAQTDLEVFRFRASGLGHLLAVSGQNTAFVLAVIAPLLLRCPLRLRAVLGIAVLVAFVVITRAEPSVLRAASMAAIAMVAVSTGRVVTGTRVLAIAVVALLVADPLLVHAVGFGLSVGATLGLMFVSRPVAQRLPGPRPLREALASTLAAQLGAAPFMLWLWSSVPAVAPLANLLAVPVAGVVMVLGSSVGIVAGVVRPEVAAVVQWPTEQMVRWVDAVAAWSSRVPLAPLGPVRFVLVGATVGAVLWHTAGAEPGAERRPRWRPPVAALLGAAAMCVLVWPPSLAPGRHRIAPGAVLVVTGDGGRRLDLAASARTLATLEGLHRLAVGSLSGIGAPAGSSTADAVADHVRAARPSGRSPPS